MLNIDCEKFNDAELVGLVLSDQSYYACLVQRYEEVLKRYIYRLSSASNEEAEDILQNVFLKVYLNLNDFDSDLKFSSWIYRITHNEVISNFRKQQSRPQIDSSDDNNKLSLLAADFSHEAEIDKKINRVFYNEVLQKMDEKYREVLILKFLEEKDYLEIADILKKPMGTIATLINRAKKQFREVAERENIKF